MAKSLLKNGSRENVCTLTYCLFSYSFLVTNMKHYLLLMKSCQYILDNIFKKENHEIAAITLPYDNVPCNIISMFQLYVNPNNKLGCYFIINNVFSTRMNLINRTIKDILN